MPGWSPDIDIEFVCASKTHMVHAHKLVKEGNRTLYNQPEAAISLRTDDVEGHEIQAQGPVCVIYYSSLWSDHAAMLALSATDNLNADVQWGEDEMQAYGRVHQITHTLSPNQDEDPMDVEELKRKVYEHVQITGMGKFSQENWNQLITLRLTLPSSIADLLKTIQFSACGSRVSVSVKDFGLVAKLDPSTPWAKVAILLWQYIGFVDQKKPTPASSTTFTGRKVIRAQALKPKTIQELIEEPDLLMSVQEFIAATLQRTQNRLSLIHI